MIEFHSFFKNTSDKKEKSLLFKEIKKEKKDRVSAYYELPYSTEALQTTKTFMRVREEVLAKIDTLVIVGIGGSSLGLKAIDSMLSHLSHRRKISLRFLEHTDPILIVQNLEGLNVENTLFIVISKSGTTIETTSLMKYVLCRYNLLSVHKEHLLVITDCDSALANWADENDIYSLTIDPLIGGRFSVLSHVGITPLMLLGYNVEEILKGAREVEEKFFNRELDCLLEKAIYYAKNYRKYPINVLFSYSSAFTHFNAWYVQLWGESLGKINKESKSVGLTPVSLIGSIDQHSFLQLIVQGPNDKSVTFLSVRQFGDESVLIPDMSLSSLESTDFVNGISFKKLLRLQRESTMETLIARGVPTDLIIVDELSEKTAGILIFSYEILTSCIGSLFQINTYDQPGVEFGKQLLRSKLTLP
ncbi:glucose-6-phosphate isomerase [Helicobacter monodelphidis]|uniref:glucose-6-phosphate isomerase n=1 Tax=Helicobacter sp. 15-1451 TaxID=2004995 RepID=UPI000DCB0E56|nr:glucose-6-phosphate isomerase [Helicobacter sp. 15-1451]RAX58161.1 glucose-6-phosphate isomerase [Helicobacter sp. 15-1451]